MAFYFLYRYLCKHDLYFLGTKVLGYHGALVDPIFHKWLCSVLEQEKSTLLLLPREHTKSTWGLAIKVTQDIVRDPNISILIASKTAKMSCDRLDVIKRHLATTPLSLMFPEIISEQPERDAMSKSSRYRDLIWKRDEICVLRDTNQMEKTVETAGITQYRTGRHYHRMYLDDIIDDATVLSETESLNALQFEQTLIPMLREQEGGLIRQYGTRWGSGDLYEWLIDKILYTDPDESVMQLKNWQVISREVKEDYDTYCKYTPISKEEYNRRKVWDEEDDCDKIYIFSYFNDEVLASKRSHINDDYLFFLNYYNKVIRSEDKVFPPPYKEVQDLPQYLDYYLTIDPAFTVTKQSDYTALVVCGYDKEGHIYVAEAQRYRGDPDGLLKLMYKFYEQYGYKVCGIEKGGWQLVLANALEYARKLQGGYALPIKAIDLGNATDSKANRIRGLSYFFKRGVVFLRRGLDDLKRELMRFPSGARSKDDLLDALSMQPNLISWRKDKRVEEKNFKREPDTYRKYIEKHQRANSINYVRY